MARTKSTKTVKKVEEKKEEKKNLYHITIVIGSDVFDIETDDIASALLNDFHPLVVKSKVKFNIAKGDRRIERLVLPRLARRYFTNKLFAQVFAKNITTLLN